MKQCPHCWIMNSDSQEVCRQCGYPELLPLGKKPGTPAA